MHVLIVGTTGSGKTTLGTQLVDAYSARNRHSVVLDPMLDSRWHTRWLTADPREFLKWASSSRSCMLFIDESGEMVGQYRDEMFWLATRARHLGHLSHFLTQRPTQISPTVRNQCTHLYAFGLAYSDAVATAKDWARSQADRVQIEAAGGFVPFEFVHVGRFSPPKLYKLTIPDTYKPG